MLSITDKEIKSEKWFFLCHCESSWNINQIINLVLWLRHSTKSHPVFRDYVWKKGECYWATAESMLNVDSFRKILFSAWWICESTNQKTLWWSNSSCHHLISRLNNLKACCESPVFVSELCCHTLVLLFFLKHYVETKEKTGRVLYRATAKMSKKCSLPMMPLREIWVQSVRSKV